MHMRKIFIPIVALLWLGPSAQAQVPPDQIAREQTTHIIDLVKANRAAYAKDYRKLYAMVDEQVLPHFDFRVMAKSVLGRHWREATEEQRARFIEEFRDLLVRTYATALLKYNDEEFRFLPLSMKPGDTTAVVRSEVVPGGGAPPVAIHYSFYVSGSAWKVYDVVIEGVSLVTNYRSTYSQRIQANGLDGLIQSLAEANRRGEVDKTAIVAPVSKSK